jgi:hypothetical protein
MKVRHDTFPSNPAHPLVIEITVLPAFFERFPILTFVDSTLIKNFSLNTVDKVVDAHR